MTPVNWIFIFLVVASFFVEQAKSSGVFELQLLSFDNEAGKDDYGKCCSGKAGRDSTTEDCDGLCRPRFFVCLKEYQATIDTDSPCTFGEFITSAQNSANDSSQDGFASPIGIAFPFTWPRTFSLIVEAWHGNLSSGVLISRLSIQSYLDVKADWTKDTHQSKYSMLRFQYRVTCMAHYYGRGCENLCRPRDDQFGHYTCSPMGDRVCLAGWQGDYCTKPRCAAGCDEQHGSCTKPNECKCQTGWEGPLCNQCQRYPGCMHGSCMKPWDCICNEGWGGLFCNQDLNFCTNHKPCRNGGTCFNTGQGSYTCQCMPGYSGKECEVSVNDCATIPCQNGGTCARHQPNNTYSTCECPLGFHGPHCETSVRICAQQPCAVHGTASCTDTRAGYTCQCRPGFSGTDCDQHVNDCSPNPCLNAGACVNVQDSYQCVCHTGFTGDRCETNIDDCQGDPCENGGSCIDKVNEFRCQCVPGFVGQLCQKRVDVCMTKPCANGGKCLQLTNDYMCECAAGFSGKDCSIEVDECRSQPCQYGGTCVNRVHGFECQCPPGYGGRVCANEDRLVVDDDESGSAAPSVAPSARVSSGESNLTTEHVVVIATISTFVPLLVLVAVGVIICLKQRRKREKARADEEARLQNEQNTAHSSFAKRSAATIAADTHMIKNSWGGGVVGNVGGGKCTNNVLLGSSNVVVSPSSLSMSPDDCSVVSNVSEPHHEIYHHSKSGVGPHHQVIDGRSFYSIPRTRSQKQLNTDPPATRTSSSSSSALLLPAGKQLYEQDYEHLKRLSVMSNSSSAMCGSSDPSLLKRPSTTVTEKDSNGGVYVIEEHFHRPDAISSGLFATEV